MKKGLVTNKLCSNCCFSTYASSAARAVLICRQRVGSVGRWHVCEGDACSYYYPLRVADPGNQMPRVIPLTQGKFAIVDAKRYAELACYKWLAVRCYNTFYAVRKSRGKTIRMHRVIMGAPESLVVDHINHDGLDNRKSNLRICTNTQNRLNARGHRGVSSKYKGVCWHKRDKLFQANINCNKKVFRLGSFKNERDAAKAYDEKAVELFGEYACLNFPESK